MSSEERHQEINHQTPKVCCFDYDNGMADNCYVNGTTWKDSSNETTITCITTITMATFTDVRQADQGTGGKGVA